MQGERHQSRFHSDEEDQYDVMYDQETPLMASELAVQEPRYSAPRMKSVPKVYRWMNAQFTLFRQWIMLHMYNSCM